MNAIDKIKHHPILASALVIVLLIALILLYRYKVERPVDYDAIEEHFKYGSIGSEPRSGVPYWIWKVLPVMFPEKIPEGNDYRAFGFLYEEGKDLPIGVSRRRVQGIDFVWLNCAVCHSGTVRENPQAQRQIYLGMPANNFRLYRFVQFLREVALENRFNTDNVLAAIENLGGRLGLMEKIAYRFFVVDRVRGSLIGLRQQLAFLDRQHAWGPGRVDTFNPYKAIQFNFPMDRLPEAELTGPADYPSIWQQAPREGMQLHWDGNNPSVEERNKSAALGAGVTPVTIDLDRIKRIEDWLWNLKPPAFPKPVDPALAKRGEILYDEYCATCHGKQKGGAYVFDTSRFPRLGTVEPLKHIGTDPGRFISYSEDLAAVQNTLYAGYPWRFSHFRKTDGYANMPLDGLWLRSPYLHNGSVPTLRDLLEPSSRRPVVFYRGYDVFDWQRVGFIADVPEEGGRRFYRFDTREPGNSNAGHEGENYGTHLSPEDKDALVEYMKTF